LRARDHQRFGLPVVQADVPRAISATMAQWRNFQTQMRQKRTGKKKENDGIGTDEIIIQRLSSEVSGKAQKYSRVGPREFVDFGEERDLTIPNIKEACLKHFRSKIGPNMICDVVAGEQGPSCTSTKQIPNMKLIYVRFIDGDRVEVDGDVSVDDHHDHAHVGGQSLKKRKHHSSTNVHPISEGATFQMKSPRKKVKPVPKSLSVSAILKLGRVMPNTTLLNLYAFNFQTMTWSNLPIPVEFIIASEMLGEGGFRKAYKAKSSTKDFAKSEWVIKRYKESAIKEIEEIQQTLAGHTKKVVQMHHLARNFAARLEEKVGKNDLKDLFGQVMYYNNIFMGMFSDGEFVTVEEFVEGDMEKYVNNDGNPCIDDNIMIQDIRKLSVWCTFLTKIPIMKS